MMAHWYKNENVGDTLTPVILKHFLRKKISYARRNYRGKILAVGSIMKSLRPKDIVWGTGIMRETDKFTIENNRFLAVRGKLTRKILLECGADVPEIYGDPALLMPLIYSPDVRVCHDLGIVEHYVDKGLYEGNGYKIDVNQDWRKFIEELKSCKKILSSSLHGLILADAYGIPCEWIKLSDKVLGQGFKFRDYLSGTDRTSFDEPLKKEKLKEIQDKLLKALDGISRMNLQEIRTKQAMEEIGMDGEIKIVHAEDVKTFINNKEYKLIFPKFIMNYDKEKTIEMIFIGLLTPKRKEFLNNFKDALIINSDKGRKQETKKKDDEYFKLLSKSKFALCPSGDFKWTYRFFESILCRCIPIVEEDCKLYEGYKYYKLGDDYKYNQDWIEHNLNKIKEMMLWM